MTSHGESDEVENIFTSEERKVIAKFLEVKEGTVEAIGYLAGKKSTTPITDRKGEGA